MYLQLLARGSCQEHGASVYHNRVVPATRNGQITSLTGLLKSEVSPLAFVLYTPVLGSSMCMWVFILQVSYMLHTRLCYAPRYKAWYHPRDINP